MPRLHDVPGQLTHGPFTILEARRVGVVWRQLQSSNWRRVGRGAYAGAGLGESPLLVLQAARRRLPTEAAFSGQTAAWLHGLDVEPCAPVEATISTDCGVSGRGGLRLRRARLDDGDVVLRRGLRATSILRTLADLAHHISLVEATVIADAALHRGLVTLADMNAYCEERAGRKGFARLRKVLAHAEPAAESQMETRLRMLLVLARLPRPRAQVSLYDCDGRFLGRPDLVYQDAKLVLEYDGETHRENLADDNRRQNRLQNAGFRMLRFTAADVLRGGDLVVAQVRDALR